MSPVRQRGFTLLEVLVAVAIFAVVAYMAYGGFDAVLKQQQIIEQSGGRLRAVQYAVRRLTQDLAQLQPRPIREALGEGWRPALIAGGRGLEAIELTRGGWANPLANPRPTLQRVAWRVEDGILLRADWPVLDRVLDADPDETEVLTGVDELRLRFLVPGGDWIEQWPPTENPDPEAMRALPAAVEVVLVLKDWGEITRLVEVAR